MINEVFLVGKVAQAKEREDGRVLDLLVDYKRYYGYGDNANFSVTTHNVYLVSNTGAVKQFINNSNEVKKPVYIGVYGLLSERNLPPKEGQEYGPSQVYILGLKVLQLSNEVESSECRAFFQGDILWKETKYNKKGTPMTKMIVKNKRTRRDKNGDSQTISTGVPVTVFKESLDVPFDKGDTVMFAGNLDSYEMRDYPGIFTSNLTSFDFLGASVSSAIEDPTLASFDVVTEVPITKSKDVESTTEPITMTNVSQSTAVSSAPATVIDTSFDDDDSLPF